MHTTGPWEALKSGVYSSALCVAMRHPEAGSEWDANARLIAAAPDLLAAVEDMMHDIEIFYAKYREPGSKYLVNLKAAIAKAKGE
jgi:hypothetical protein